MEAQRRRLGTVFPGYNGPALRRAMRSSRGRAKSSLHVSKCGKGTGFFELLATVAGQFLQDADKGEEHSLWDNSKCDVPMIHSCLSSKESVAECNKVSTFGADQPMEMRKCGTLQILCSSHESPPMCNGKVDQASEVPKMVEQNDTPQSTTVLCKPVAVTHSQRQVLCSMIGFNEKYEDASANALQGGCTTEWEEERGEHVEPIAIINDDGFSAKSDNESGTASVESKEKAGRLNGSFNQEKQEPCRINQVAHEYNLKDTKWPDFRTLSEDVLSNEMMMEQEGEFEEECSSLKGQNYEHKEEVEVVRKIQALEEAPVKESLSQLGKNEGFFGKKKCTFFSERMYDNEIDENSLPTQSQSVNKYPKALIKMDDRLMGSLRSREHVQRIIDFGKKAPGLNSSKKGRNLNCKTEASEEILSECVMPKLKTKKCIRITNQNIHDMIKWHRGSGSCKKRKHVEKEPPAVTGRKFEEQFLYGENAYSRERSRRVYKLRRKRMCVEEDKVTALSLHPNGMQNTECHSVNGEPPAAAAKLHRAKTVSVASSPNGRGAFCKFSTVKSSEPHVKVNIKSFMVPELFVDLPESATVANLKKAVMDAAMNVLGGGLRVRVLLQGNKVSDEGATLVQLGISRTGKPESLGFMLEPNPTSTSSSNLEDPLLLLSHAASQPSPRCAAFQNHGAGHEGKCCPPTKKWPNAIGDSDVTDTENTLPSNENIFADTKLTGKIIGASDESLKACKDRELKLDANEEAPLSLLSTKVATMGAMVAMIGQEDLISLPKHETDSTSSLSEVTPLPAYGAGAIILHPGIAGKSAQGMALVSMNQNSQLEVGKRRIRRPFSVGEVEALVLAVEKLGTGRWRDVKVCAFDQAKHRTYVDLKDKWKTLVHTAQIAPHQRRGEPVPEELLQRVIQANSYWTTS
ncbi:hypothetical protein O6H91_17G045400 [Diphasiastrum complanatum]|uniref:Uncharacterized protein n=1 Tax=Diphasiastrum complanatum TaxID=34168 RepID=A0ACC2B6C1_DIPCM|nr:hypothetical protein O6H91_17G045400 [Diphasiastrum complanatum]